MKEDNKYNKYYGIRVHKKEDNKYNKYNGIRTRFVKQLKQR